MRRKAVLIAPLLAAALVLPGAPTGAAQEGSGDLAAALAAAEESLRRGETQVAGSRYREVLAAGWIALGELAAHEGRDEDARAAFERAECATVAHRRASTALALLDMNTGRADEAVRRLQRLLAENLDDLETRRLLAAALFADGRPEQAIQELQEARARSPEDPELAYSLATAHLRAGQPEAAEGLFAEVARARPIPATHVLLGRTYRDAGFYGRAEAELERALLLDPATPRAHFYLGTLHLLDARRAELEEAMADFRRELEVAPDDPSAHLYLGMALVESRRPEEAVEHLERAAGEAGTALDGNLFLGRALVATGRGEEAVAAFRRALERAEEMPAGEGAADERLRSIHYQLGLALRRAGDPEAAAVHLEAAERITENLTTESRSTLSRFIESDPNEGYGGPAVPRLDTSRFAGLDREERTEVRRGVEAALTRSHLNLGILQARSGRAARAARLLTEAARLDPDFPGVQRSLGVVLFNAGRHAEAIEALRRALAETPANRELSRMLGLAHLEAENYTEAAELLGKEVRSAGSPDDPSLLYAYGLALVRGGRADEAEGVFAELTRRFDESARVQVLLGEAQAQGNDFAAAVEHFERALELDPQVADARPALGVIRLRQGELVAAEEVLRDELELRPGNVRARFLLATVLDLVDRSGEAAAELRRVLAATPGDVDARYLLGKALLGTGDADDALAQLQTAAELAPGDANVHYQLGRAHRALGQRDEAEAAFQRYRELKAGEAADTQGATEAPDLGEAPR